LLSLLSLLSLTFRGLSRSVGRGFLRIAQGGV
jgi:hypothetical protein